jgi:hypothetical protein
MDESERDRDPEAESTNETDDHRTPVETASVQWYVETEQVTARHRRTALFRRTPVGWVCQHIRGVHLRQKGATESYIDDRATVADVPDHVLARAGIDRADTVTRRAHA